MFPTGKQSIQTRKVNKNMSQINYATEVIDIKFTNVCDTKFSVWIYYFVSQLVIIKNELYCCVKTVGQFYPNSKFWSTDDEDVKSDWNITEYLQAWMSDLSDDHDQ